MNYDNDFPMDEATYDREEARMGARWMRADGKPCPCGGSGWLLTSRDDVVRCSCGAPPGRHPWDDGEEDSEGLGVQDARQAEEAFRGAKEAFRLPDDDLPF